METVELNQKKALLVKFEKGECICSPGKEATKATASSKALKKQSGAAQQPSIVSYSPSVQVAGPATQPKSVKSLKKKAVPVAKKSSIQGKKQDKKPVIAKKSPIQGEKQDIIRDKKPVKVVINKDKTGQKAEQKAKVPPKTSLGESRKNKGFFKGIRESIRSSFKKQNEENNKRDSLLAKAFSDTDDAKEVGALALLGPIAPAIQQTKELIVGKDKDDKEGKSLFGKMFGKKKDKPKTAEENLKRISEKSSRGVRDSKGRFIPGAKKDKFSSIAGKGVPYMQGKKAPVNTETVDKLEVIHNDLVNNEKDQKKRDKKMIKAAAKVGSGAGGGIMGGLLDFLPGGKGKGGKGFFGKMIGKGSGLLGKGKGLLGKVAGKVGLKGLGKAGIAGAGTVAATKGGGLLSKVFGKSSGKVAEKGGGLFSKIAGKFGGKTVAKAGTKGIGKSVLKKIPGISIIAGLAFGAQRMFSDEKDVIGGLGEVASGFLGTIPLIGTAASLAIDAALIARDVSKAGEKKISGLTAEQKAVAIKEGRSTKADPWMKKAQKKANTDTWMKKKVNATEDRTSKRITDKKSKINQTKVDASNVKMLSETQKTNKLLEEMLKNNRNTPVTTNQGSVASNGIANNSDIMSIKGLD